MLSLFLKNGCLLNKLFLSDFSLFVLFMKTKKTKQNKIFFGPFSWIGFKCLEAAGPHVIIYHCTKNKNYRISSVNMTKLRIGHIY